MPPRRLIIAIGRQDFCPKHKNGRQDLTAHKFHLVPPANLPEQNEKHVQFRGAPQHGRRPAGGRVRGRGWDLGLQGCNLPEDLVTFTDTIIPHPCVVSSVQHRP